MHQVTADKFGMVQRECPGRAARLSAPGQESYLLFIHREDAAV